MQNSTRNWANCTAIAICMGVPVAAAAQEATDGTNTVLLETVTVSARKRIETAHDVPLSISVKGPEELARSTIDSGADLARDTPNFNFVDFAGPGGNYGTMRAIGPLGSPLNSLDNTIGFSVDGVPTSSFGFAPTLMDVERVEVLRGPQGTMFGRNALGGVVNVINAPADGTREFRLNAEYGPTIMPFSKASQAAGSLPICSPDAASFASRTSTATFPIRSSAARREPRRCRPEEGR